jgi:gentisate 1,2-dioxygenase
MLGDRMTLQPADFEATLTYTDTGLVARGLVARQVATHRVEPLPGRDLRTCRLDRLGGHTMTAMHLAEVAPGGHKCNHRHLDETMAFIAAGRGYTELRQGDYAAPIRADWSAGDVVVVPTNAWHRHVNSDPDRPMRQLSFRNLPLMNRLLHGPGTKQQPKPAFNIGGRFTARFDDEPDYLSSRTVADDGTVHANLVRQVADEPLPAAQDGVAVQRYVMGGQRTLEVALVGVTAGAGTAEERSLAEENVLVLRGRGHTELRDGADRSYRVDWQAGDLVCPPLAAVRRHVAHDEDVRLLRVRNVAVELALGQTGELPDRLGDLASS